VAQIGDGLAVHADLVRAAEVAARQALEPLGGRGPDLMCVFACTGERDEFAAGIRRIGELAQPTTLLGCTADGVLGGGQGVEAAPAVSVWAARLPRARVRGFQLDVLDMGEGTSARVLGFPEITTRDHVGVLVADPETFPIGGFVEQANAVLPGFPLVGGLAGRPGERGPAFVALGDSIREGGAAGVAIGGPVAVHTAVSQGCRPVGPAMAVTKADGYMVHELAGVSALRRLEEILSAMTPEDRQLATTGLSIGIAMDEYAEEHGQGDFLIRSLLGIDQEAGALVIGDVVGLGQTLRFQLRDAASAQIDLAATLSGVRAPGALRSVDGALLFSCNGRGAATFASADHDVLAVRTALSTKRVAGFFAAGEIGPVGGRNHVHGFTASVLAFGQPDNGAAAAADGGME
jgi:small ligand-binding sensory domain FIST